MRQRTFLVARIASCFVALTGCGGRVELLVDPAPSPAPTSASPAPTATPTTPPPIFPPSPPSLVPPGPTPSPVPDPIPPPAPIPEPPVLPPGGCGPLKVSFDWGSHGSGPCTATIDPGSAEPWRGPGFVLTNTTDGHTGGFAATCVNGAWQISDEKCVARGSATTCYPKGTRCDGSGPAVFPYEHCWTCCTYTNPEPGVCN